MSNLTPDQAFALLERAAISGERCPQTGDHGLRSADTTNLAHAGRILVEIFAWNYRRVTILTGPHAGKTTAAAPAGQKPWKIIDAHGTRTKRGVADTGASKRTQPSAPRPLTRQEWGGGTQ